eukprot:TRINITY_DN20516_c2_g2_i1.p1 TRINITY_DN20516_c2_g2~~TRINITY_DN20516_c2_g2_i1.p1  ORF type:complete len:617 (-),score=108.24 TRINITY_DN20516_c2_g2_i1:65-1669(-)
MRRRLQSCAEGVSNFFEVEVRGSTLGREVRAGCITWMTMSYIMVVNPVILSTSDPSKSEPVMFATAMSACAASLVVGLFANMPLALMPGMGLNAYFAFGICKAFGVTWDEAMSCCFVSGLILMLLSALGICRSLVQLVLSDHLKKAITVAIGLFQALIGFQTMGLVVSDKSTLVTMGSLEPWGNEKLYVSLLGIVLISVMLVRQWHGALLIGIWGMAAAAWALGICAPPAGVFGMPRADAVLSLSFDAWSPGSGHLAGMLTGTLVLLFVSLFDLAGVQYGLIGMAQLLEDGAVPKSNSIFFSAGFGTALGGLLGTSPVIIANECSAGIMEGAKTGVCSLVTAVLFFLSAFITPLLHAIPAVATAVPLVLIGAFMMAPVRGVDWDNLSMAIPSFLTVTVVPFTYSIHNGIIAGILMDFVLHRMPKGRQADAEVLPTPLATPQVDNRRHSNVTPNTNVALDGAPLCSPSGLQRRLSTPYSNIAGIVSSEDEKVERARRLLADIEVSENTKKPETNDVSDKDEVLRHALEAYLEGRR